MREVLCAAGLPSLIVTPPCAPGEPANVTVRAVSIRSVDDVRRRLARLLVDASMGSPGADAAEFGDGDASPADAVAAVRVAWSPPERDFGAPLSRYVVTLREGCDAAPGSAGRFVVYEGPWHEYWMLEPPPGAALRFQVHAESSDGVGPPSPEVMHRCGPWTHVL